MTEMDAGAMQANEYRTVATLPETVDELRALADQRAEAGQATEAVPVLIRLAERLGQAGQHEEALFALDRATALAGDDPALLFDMAGELAVQGAEDAAVALYDRIGDWQPRRVRLGRA